jgi:serine/threonine protein kinase
MQKKYDFRFDIYSAGCVLVGILFKDTPYFEYKKGEELFHATAMWSGLDPLLEIDDRHIIQGEYIREYRHVNGYDFFKTFKRDGLVPEDKVDSYAQVFDLLDQMLTIDYKYRPMAKELLKHPFFNEDNTNDKTSEEL